MGIFFIPVTEISVAKRDLGSQASPSSQMSTPKMLRKKEWRGGRDLGNRVSPVDRAQMKRPLGLARLPRRILCSVHLRNSSAVDLD